MPISEICSVMVYFWSIEILKNFKQLPLILMKKSSEKLHCIVKSCNRHKSQLIRSCHYLGSLKVTAASLKGKINKQIIFDIISAHNLEVTKPAVALLGAVAQLVAHSTRQCRGCRIRPDSVWCPSLNFLNWQISARYTLNITWLILRPTHNCLTHLLSFSAHLWQSSLLSFGSLKSSSPQSPLQTTFII